MDLWNTFQEFLLKHTTGNLQQSAMFVLQQNFVLNI